MDATQIIRRKAKRIQRANDLVHYLRSDIKGSDDLKEEEKNYLLDSIDRILLYLKNDDKEENKYNYDNQNPRKNL